MNRFSTFIHGRASSRKRLWLALGATLCLFSWLALGIGLLLKVGTTAMFALATLAAVTTEGLIWWAALLFGVSVYQMRRYLRDKLTQAFHPKVNGGDREDARSKSSVALLPPQGDGGTQPPNAPRNN